MNTKITVGSMVNAVVPILEMVGATDKARDTLERMMTPNEHARQIMFAGMSDEDKATAKELGEKLADAFSDFAIFVASKGAVDPD